MSDGEDVKDDLSSAVSEEEAEEKGAANDATLKKDTEKTGVPA